MMYVYINNTDRTSDVLHNSIKITNQIYQRADSCNLTIFNGTAPEENQEINIYDGAIVQSQVGATIVLQDSYELEVNAFRAGQELWLKLGDADMEKAVVSTYTESTRTIVLTAAPTISLALNDTIGELIFGGVLTRVKDHNIRLLENIEYDLTGVGFDKIFDKKIISDSWQDVDSRYVINNFLTTTINYNKTIDDLSYDNATEIRAEWIEASDGSNPDIDDTDFMEGTAAGVFAWVFSGGTALWAATPTAVDLTDLFGVASGAPTVGELMSWFKTSNFSSVTSLKVRLGSDSSNYTEFTFELRNTTDWQYHSVKAIDAVTVGTPDWTTPDYAQLRVVQTGNGTLLWNGLRVNDEDSFTMYNVDSSIDFTDLRSVQKKPTALINQMAKALDYIWYIDYERDVHFKDSETTLAPFGLTDTSNNFINMEVEVDVSQLGNEIIINGGEKTSTYTYAQVFQGNNAIREWVLRSKYKNLAITIDDNSSTDTMEATTSTTTVKATAHGLAVGDHIVNRTRSNAVREVLTVPDADTFTVETIVAQAAGDTFSKFATAKSVGIEGITDETTVNYVGNSNAQSVRAVVTESTLLSTHFIRFEYNERVPIQPLLQDITSIDAMKALGYGDGIFDLDPYTDRNISDEATAITIGQAKLQEFANAIVNITFVTEQKGLRAGQLIHIVQTVNRSLDAQYVIQKVSRSINEGRFKDRIVHKVMAGTTLFGWEEFIQKLLRIGNLLEIDTDATPAKYALTYEQVTTDDSNLAQLDGFNTVSNTEDVTTDDVASVNAITPPWQWEASVGQAVETRWDLFEWG